MQIRLENISVQREAMTARGKCLWQFCPKADRRYETIVIVLLQDRHCHPASRLILVVDISQHELLFLNIGLADLCYLNALQTIICVVHL